MRGERSGGRGWDIRGLLTSQHVPHAMSEEQQRACAEAGSAQNSCRRNGRSRIQVSNSASHGALSPVRQGNDELMRALRSTQRNDRETLAGQRMVRIGNRNMRDQPIYDGGVTR